MALRGGTRPTLWSSGSAAGARRRLDAAGVRPARGPERPQLRLEAAERVLGGGPVGAAGGGDHGAQRRQRLGRTLVVLIEHGAQAPHHALPQHRHFDVEEDAVFGQVEAAGIRFASHDDHVGHDRAELLIEARGPGRDRAGQGALHQVDLVAQLGLIAGRRGRLGRRRGGHGDDGCRQGRGRACHHNVPLHYWGALRPARTMRSNICRCRATSAPVRPSSCPRP